MDKHETEHEGNIPDAWRGHFADPANASHAGSLASKEDKAKAGQLGGKIGGKSTSEAKAAAVRENGKKGGRPKGSKNKPKPV